MMKYVVLAQLLVLLGLGLNNQYNIQHLHKDSISNADNTPSDNISSISPTDFFGNIVHNEHSVSSSTQAGTSSVRPLFNPFETSLQISSQLTAHLFQQYRFYAKHLIICLKIPDIIFPSHYFW